MTHYFKKGFLFIIALVLVSCGGRQKTNSHQEKEFMTFQLPGTHYVVSADTLSEGDMKLLCNLEIISPDDKIILQDTTHLFIPGGYIPIFVNDSPRADYILLKTFDPINNRNNLLLHNTGVNIVSEGFVIVDTIVDIDQDGIMEIIGREFTEAPCIDCDSCYYNPYEVYKLGEQLTRETELERKLTQLIYGTYLGDKQLNTILPCKQLDTDIIAYYQSMEEETYAQRELYLNHKILTTPLVCKTEPKRIIINNGIIDSIVVHSGMELGTESPFTFVYLHSGKCIESAGECIYNSQQPESPFCILEPPCCAGNLIEYHWFKYNQQQDTIEQVWKVSIFTTMDNTDIYNKDIVWHTSPKQRELQHLQLRSEPRINDTEEDYELRQIGNVIEETSKTVSVYELGYNKKQPAWRICAILYVDNIYWIGWYNSRL